MGARTAATASPGRKIEREGGGENEREGRLKEKGGRRGGEGKSRRLT